MRPGRWPGAASAKRVCRASTVRTGRLKFSVKYCRESTGHGFPQYLQAVSDTKKVQEKKQHVYKFTTGSIEIVRKNPDLYNSLKLLRLFFCKSVKSKRSSCFYCSVAGLCLPVNRYKNTLAAKPRKVLFCFCETKRSCGANCYKTRQSFFPGL